jgi:hypothetical protein
MRRRLQFFVAGLALLAAGPVFAVEEEASEASAELAPAEPLFSNGRLNAQWLWAKDKAIAGVGLNAQRPFLDFDLELSLMWTTAQADGFDGSFLGALFGIFVSFVPLRTERVDLGLGLGADIHYLGAIHQDLVEGALASRAFVRVALLEDLALFATARVYLLASDGLELGTERNGSAGLPVLFGTGLSWRLP